MKSRVSLLDKIMYFIVKHKGKQMRPMFVLFAAEMAGGITERTYRAASLIELLHTATLVHDDVVDDAEKRRGIFSVNALWKNKIAVLVGDYLLSRGLLLSVENDDFDTLRIISKAVKDMSEGELLQIEKSRLLNIDEETYYEIIRQKTATLIAAACKAGFGSVNSEPEKQEKMRAFGEKIGMAFQIKDDIFDFGTGGIGKPTGIDIKEKKMTLPLIHALNQCERSKRKYIVNLIKKHSDNKDKVNEVIDFVRKSPGLQYAEQKMQSLQAEAMDILHSFPESVGRTGLEQLIRFTTERKK